MDWQAMGPDHDAFAEEEMIMFTRIEQAIADIQQGKLIIVVDTLSVKTRRFYRRRDESKS